ncbi:hypothetical protein [Candidatus Ruminimicrobiellum ovillum]|uniref:hypothetical protein n=1 Tax=Candidatus Ruminimicrobiellum ovillum TaxID=1947927 RepID=UPI00355A7806
MKLKFFAGILCVFILTGCSAKSGNIKVNGINTKSETFKKLELADTEKIKEYLGNPDSVFKRDGFEVYEYNYRKVSNGIWYMVPFISLFVCLYYASIYGYDVYNINTLYFYIDESGKVVNSENIERSGVYPPPQTMNYKKILKKYNKEQKKAKASDK